MHSVISLKEFSDIAEATPQDNTYWIQAWRYGEWEHPAYGTEKITPEFGDVLKTNFDTNVYGQDIPLNFEHGDDPTKGKQAAGWIKEIEPREDGVYYLCEFTEDALNEIKAKKWRYISPEYDDWMNPETQEVVSSVPMGGALTNRPFFKNMAPLNFSELYAEIVSTTNTTNVGGKMAEETTTDDEGNEGGDEAAENNLLKQFGEVLGVTFSEFTEKEVLDKATELAAVIAPLKKVKQDAETTRSFRDTFPQEFAEMQNLRKSRIENDARKFAENYERFTVKDKDEKDTRGFSALVLGKIEDTHKKFSEGIVTAEDMADLLDSISEGGIVDYKEIGSSRRKEFSGSDTTDPRKQFSEVVAGLMGNDELSYEDAIVEAAKSEPELYQAYLTGSNK